MSWPYRRLPRLVRRVKRATKQLLRTVLPEPVSRWLKARIRGRPYVPPTGSVRFGDLRRVAPLSRAYGYDRGVPVDRHYIEKFLKDHAADVRGHTLEVGADAYTRRFGGDAVSRADVLHVSPDAADATIVADLAAAAHVPSNVFDCFILTQTLQLIFDLRAAMATIHRILRPGGVVLATVPGLSQLADDEWGASWHWSFTPLSVRRLFESVFEPENVTVTAHGNVLAATAFLHGMAAGELRHEELEYHDPSYPLLITVRAVKSTHRPLAAAGNGKAGAAA